MFCGLEEERIRFSEKNKNKKKEKREKNKKKKKKKKNTSRPKVGWKGWKGILRNIKMWNIFWHI